MLDCTRCGACCSGLTVILSPEDEARLSVDEVLALSRYHEEREQRVLKQHAGGRCIALRVEGGRFLCSIYDRRPDACREFEESSRRCVELREVRGIS